MIIIKTIPIIAPIIEGNSIPNKEIKNDTIKTTVKTDTSRFEIGQTVRYEIYMMGCLTRQKLTPLSN